MQSLLLTLATKENRRRLLAAVFMIVFLAELGSHGVICTNLSSVDEQTTVSATDKGHEDPCDTLILCRDDNRKDRQTPNLSHDAAQHNALFDRFSDLDLPGFQKDPPIPLTTTTGLFRPPSPPFHPPELS